jgi:ketosteroid isomerase-like protein
METAETTVLSDFFERYATAMTANDMATVAACYAMPGMVVADDSTFTFATPAAVETAFSGAVQTYHEKGLVAARAEVLDVQWLTSALALTRVTWEYLDRNGGAVPGETYRYLMRMVQGRPLICVVIPTG